MIRRTSIALLAAAVLNAQLMMVPAMAENQMGYTLLPASEASQLPRGGGVLGMNVSRGQQINDSTLSFQVLRVDKVRGGTPASQAGLKSGDQVIAVDGRVFPTTAAFVDYVGSKQAGQQVSIDYMPANAGPKEAQRVSVTLGDGKQAVTPAPAPPVAPAAPASTGLSTGTKVAIGIGAAALFGCYKFGCFSRRKAGTVPATR